MRACTEQPPVEPGGGAAAAVGPRERDCGAPQAGAGAGALVAAVLVAEAALPF